LNVSDEDYSRNVPDEGYSRNVPDEDYSRNVPDEGYSRNVPDEGYSRDVPDEDYSRNALCALNLVSTFLLAQIKYEQEIVSFLNHETHFVFSTFVYFWYMVQNSVLSLT